jgi:hypothetical protein
VVEHYLDTVGVTGSNPVPRTIANKINVVFPVSPLKKCKVITSSHNRTPKFRLVAEWNCGRLMRCVFPGRVHKWGMKKCALALLVSISTSHASTLLDYTPPDNEHTPLYAHSPGVPASYASSFTVGQQDVEIASISFRLGGVAPSSYDFTAYLFNHSSDRPGNLLTSSHRFFNSGELPTLPLLDGLAWCEFSFVDSITLSANSVYWVGIGTSSAGYPPYIAYTSLLSRFTDLGIAPSLTHCTTANYPPSGQWGVNAPEITLAYELQGIVIPEPASGLLLIAFGCVQICGIRCRVSQC